MVFGIELLLKFIINPKYFITSPWNVISFMVIMSSLCCVIFEFETDKSDFLFIKSIFLAFQMFRFVLLVKDIFFLRKFFLTLKLIFVKSLPFLSLFFLTLFSYALIGCILFCYLKPQKYITNDINFTTIFFSMFTLIRVATSEGWFFILADVSRSQSVNFICKDFSIYFDYEKYGLNMCGTVWAYPFFYSFIILILLIFNLIVGEMINASEDLKKQQEKAINVYQLNDIVKLWGCFDHEGSGFMSFKDFWKFASQIAKILGFQTDEFLNLQTKKKFLHLLELPVYIDIKKGNIFCFSFYDVVLAFSRIAVIIKLNLKK